MKEITFDEASLIDDRSSSARDAWASLVRDPGLFVRHWNYKGAILSGGLRASVFLITYLLSRESVKLAIGAAIVQFVFRFFFAGLSGALIQAFRLVAPAWKALISILLVVPLISHVFEFLVQAAFVQYTATTDHTGTAILMSICVSVFSALFALFIMRRDVMIVGEAESKPLLSDIKRFPELIYEFVALIPNEIAAMLRRGAVARAAASFAAFGLFSQVVCWAVTNKPFWTYGGGKTIEIVRFWAIDGMILMMFAVTLSLIGLRRRMQ